MIFAGYCHGCRRDDCTVQTRYDRGARTLCDECYRLGAWGDALWTDEEHQPWQRHRAEIHFRILEKKGLL